MPYGTPVHNNTILLQSTLSSASSGAGSESVGIHHPITCTSKLYYDEDGTFSCEHASAPPGEARTQACVIHSLVLLLLEPAVTIDSGWSYKTPEQLEAEWFEKHGEVWQ